MNEQNQKDLSTLNAGDWIIIYPYADKKYSVEFRSVDMVKQTLTVNGDFSVTHRVTTVNDMTPKNIKQVGTRTFQEKSTCRR